MKISVNQLRLELADIEQSHLQLNTFFWGDFPRAVNEENINYPLMASYFPNAGFLDNQTTLPITIVIADKIYDDYTNLNDVESDTLQICRDVFNIMNKSTRWQKIGRVESCSLTKFIESNADVCAGYVMTVNFTLRDSNSICDLPMSGYDFDQDIASSCLPVQIYRNGVLVDTVASGGTYSYTTDAFTYTIKNTNNATLYSGTVTANLSVTIQDCTVSNSDASYSATVTAEGSLDLPDITVDVINSLDVVVSTQISASVKDVTISAPDGTINIKKTGDGTISSQSVPSGATVDYNVADNAITVNSANGFSIDATDPLDIVLTDSNGSTLTPNSVTPNSGTHKVDIVLPANVPPVGATLLQTGQTVSLSTNDDITRGRSSSFLVLSSNNPWGNTNRFTDTLGGSTYANGIVIDWSTYNGSTVLCYYIGDSSTTRNWTTQLNQYISSTIGGLTGWHLWNRTECYNLLNPSVTGQMNYAPFNFGGTKRYYFTATSIGSSVVYADLLGNAIVFQGTTTTNSLFGIWVRYSTVTGTTLS